MLVGTGRTDRVIIVKASSVLNVNMTLMNVLRIVSVNVTTTRRQWKMTDDIVTRLRRDVDAVTYIKGVFPTSMISAEAADEIEYLRKERDRWAEFAIHIATCPNWGRRTCWDCVSPTNQDQARQAGLEDVIRSEYGKR
jgi:hypothetical protein